MFALQRRLTAPAPGATMRHERRLAAPEIVAASLGPRGDGCGLAARVAPVPENRGCRGAGRRPSRASRVETRAGRPAVGGGGRRALGGGRPPGTRGPRPPAGGDAGSGGRGGTGAHVGHRTARRNPTLRARDGRRSRSGATRSPARMVALAAPRARSVCPAAMARVHAADAPARVGEVRAAGAPSGTRRG